jgi:hypothetical protein
VKGLLRLDFRRLRRQQVPASNWVEAVPRLLACGCVELGPNTLPWVRSP